MSKTKETGASRRDFLKLAGTAAPAAVAAASLGTEAEAAERVRPGGRLVWSTCTLEPEENRQRVRAFLERHPDWTLDREIEAQPASGGPIDGGYAARLVRS